MHGTRDMLIKLNKIVKSAKDKKEIYNTIAKMAEVEGFKIEPYEDENKNKE